MTHKQSQGFTLFTSVIFLLVLSLFTVTSLNAANFHSQLTGQLAKTAQLQWIATSANRLVIQQLPDLLNENPALLTSSDEILLPSNVWSGDAAVVIASKIHLLELATSCVSTTNTTDACYRFAIQSTAGSDQTSHPASTTEEYLLIVSTTGENNE